MATYSAAVRGQAWRSLNRAALRAIVNQGADLASLGPQLLGMAVWVVITFVIAVRLFRWE